MMNVLLIQVLCRDVLQPDVPDLRYTREDADAINLSASDGRWHSIGSWWYDFFVNNNGGGNNDGQPNIAILIDQNQTAVDAVAETFTYNIVSSTGHAVFLIGGNFTIGNINATEDKILFDNIQNAKLSMATFGNNASTLSP